MIQISPSFIQDFAPNEQIIMLQLLLSADENGVAEFSDRKLSKTTGFSYQQVRTIHQKLLFNGVISNATANATANAKGVFVKISKYDSYNVINIFSNATANATTNAKTEKSQHEGVLLQDEPENSRKEKQKRSDTDEQLLLTMPIDNKKEKTHKKEKDALFEECWLAYKRKGSKAEALTQWQKLSDKDKSQVLSHIQAYTRSRERQFQKDFQRYLRDKTFNDVIFKGNAVVYDPEQCSSEEYKPLSNGVSQNWNPNLKCLEFYGYIANLNDGYTDDNRPDGARVYCQLHYWNWSKQRKEWIMEEI